MTFTTYRTPKWKLLREFSGLPKRDLSKSINHIIAEKRKMDFCTAKQKQYLNSNEVLAFLESIGEPPENYGRLVTLPETPLKKTVLKNLLTPINDRYFYRLANTAIKKGGIRSIQRMPRFLFYKELLVLLDLLGEVVPKNQV